MATSAAPLDRRRARPAPRRVPRHHDLEDPLPREPGPRSTRSARRRATASSTPADVERLRLILRQQKRALPAAEGDQGAARRARPGERHRRASTRPGAATAADGADGEPARPTPATADGRAARPRRARPREPQADDAAPATPPSVPIDDGRRRPRASAETRREPHPRRARARPPASTDDELGRARGVRAASRPAHDDAATACCSTTTRSRSPASRRRSCGTASRPATCACTARSPSAKRCCSSRCCCRTAASATPRRRRAPQETLGELAGLGRRLRTALLRQAVRGRSLE